MFFLIRIFSPFRVAQGFQATFWHYSGFGAKLSPFFGFAKSFQIQNHLSIKPIAQIRCSGCYAVFF
jgi:hypothetical protein